MELQLLPLRAPYMRASWLLQVHLVPLRRVLLGLRQSAGTPPCVL